MAPLTITGIEDDRGRFREVFCTILEERSSELPDILPCEEALARVGKEKDGSGEDVSLGSSSAKLTALLVPGVGWDCFAEWLDIEDSIGEHLRRYGYDLQTLHVDGLSSSVNNAKQVRDAALALAGDKSGRRFVLIGYSKGSVDILEALIRYPELHEHVAAVVSLAGSIGGSPLANTATQSQLALLQYWPDAQCDEGDGGVVASLRPDVRQDWLAESRLPDDIPMFSLATFPEPKRISSVLKSSYNKLSRIDARNDGQVLFYDQLIPGSTLLGYLNADHWAVAVPIARTHSIIGSIIVDENAYPREALFEAVMRYVEEVLATVSTE